MGFAEVAWLTRVSFEDGADIFDAIDFNHMVESVSSWVSKPSVRECRHLWLGSDICMISFRGNCLHIGKGPLVFV